MPHDLTLDARARRFLAAERRKRSVPTNLELAFALRLCARNSTPRELNCARQKAFRVRLRVEGPKRPIKSPILRRKIGSSVCQREVPLYDVRDSGDTDFLSRAPAMVTLDIRVFPVARGEFHVIQFGTREHLSFAPNGGTKFIVRLGERPRKSAGGWAFVSIDGRPCVRFVRISEITRDNLEDSHPNKVCYIGGDFEVVTVAEFQTALKGEILETLFGTELNDRLVWHGSVVALTCTAVGVSLRDFTSRR